VKRLCTFLRLQAWMVIAMAAGFLAATCVRVVFAGRAVAEPSNVVRTESTGGRLGAFLRLQSVVVIAVAVALLVAGPARSALTDQVAVASESAIRAAGIRSEARKISEPPKPAGPRTSVTANVRTEPRADSPVAGVIPRGALIEITGRDATGQWVAVVFPPNSSFQAWLPLNAIAGLNATSLEPAPVRPVQ
jgi:Bacterial SH3 domain